jgi:hypothetical protein
MAQNLEETFLTHYLKALKEVADRETRFITVAVSSHEEYAERVGFLRAIDEAKVLFEETQRKFFAEYRK